MFSAMLVLHFLELMKMSTISIDEWQGLGYNYPRRLTCRLQTKFHKQKEADL